MMDLNEIIISNIYTEMRKASIKQIDLALAIGVSKQTMSKMLSGDRTINAVELAKIANAIGVSVDNLVKIPVSLKETNVVRAFMGEVNSSEAKQGLEIADKLADMICFHLHCKENGERMMRSFDE